MPKLIVLLVIIMVANHYVGVIDTANNSASFFIVFVNSKKINLPTNKPLISFGCIQNYLPIPHT